MGCIDGKNVDTSYAITPLTIFVGKLESYYDAIICGLKADMTHDSKVCYDTDDKHIEEIERLKAEIKKLKSGTDAVENAYLKETISTLEYELNKAKSSHYPKEYKAEAEEYFEHNPQCKKLLFFLKVK